MTTISAKIVLDSLGPSGKRLTTFELTYPRIIHSEVLTHRVFSRNAASSRAIPIKKMLERIRQDPFVPIWWGKNEPGMQSYQEIEADDMPRAKRVWMLACEEALSSAEALNELGLHKQIINRVVEPFMHITVLLTGTSFSNLFYLRGHHAAEPHFQMLAREMKKAYDASTPKVLEEDDWHLPFISREDWENARDVVARDCYCHDDPEGLEPCTVENDALELLKKVSAGRSARVSYMTHDGKRDLEKDVELYERLIAGLKTNEPCHSSPLEHVARALATSERSGCFEGWHQFRKDIPGEAGPVENS